MCASSFKKNCIIIENDTQARDTWEAIQTVAVNANIMIDNVVKLTKSFIEILRKTVCQ